MRGLAQKVTRNLRTIQDWSKRFKWPERIEKRERQIFDRLREKNDSEYVKAQHRQLEIAKAVQTRFAVRLIKDDTRRMEQGATKYEPTAADAVKWASQEMLLLGAATSRPEIGMSAGVIEGLLAAITAAIRKVIPALCPHCKTSLDLQPKIAQSLIEASHRFTQDSKPVEKAPL